MTGDIFNWDNVIVYGSSVIAELNKSYREQEYHERRRESIDYAQRIAYGRIRREQLTAQAIGRAYWNQEP